MQMGANGSHAATLVRHQQQRLFQRQQSGGKVNPAYCNGKIAVNVAEMNGKMDTLIDQNQLVGVTHFSIGYIHIMQFNVPNWKKTDSCCAVWQQAKIENGKS